MRPVFRTLVLRMLGLVTVTSACSIAACSTGKVPQKDLAEPVRTTKCWVGQLTKIDDTGYRLASVPMLLRIERDPSRSRMVRELALGNPSTVTRDAFHVSDSGELSFVESDLAADGYQARGQVEEPLWAGNDLQLELQLPEQSVRVREWSKNDILYGHYRYRDEHGEYGDERFHALTPIEGRECTDRMSQASEGTIDPGPGQPGWAAQPSPQPSAVSLRFAWPANLDATIRQRIVRSGTPSSAATAVDAVYQLRTTPLQEGTRVVVRARELLAMPSHTLDDEDRWERATVLASLFPAVLVDDEGAVSELAEEEDYLEVVRTAFLERWGGGQDTTDEDVLEYVDSNLSAELAKVSAQRYWNPLVAFWAGAEMTIGQYEEVDLTRALYVPGAVKPVVVEVPTEYGVEGWVPCHEDAEDRSCVKLVARYSIGEHDVRRELADAGKDGKPIRVERHRDSTESVLIADPETLLPYHYYEVRELDSVMGGATDRKVIQRREVMDLLFYY